MNNCVGRSSEAGVVVWVTGLSGSGKSALCRALYKKLKPELHGLVLLDGDDVRAAAGPLALVLEVNARIGSGLDD
jgi:adenylylsulfate kinase-like enzyme